ncbi:MAG: hypothetical protein ACOC5G_04110 [Acidobacteriota bacterium]
MKEQIKETTRARLVKVYRNSDFPPKVVFEGSIAECERKMPKSHQSATFEIHSGYEGGSN